jgi:hypothetical protein
MKNNFCNFCNFGNDSNKGNASNQKSTCTWQCEVTAIHVDFSHFDTAQTYTPPTSLLAMMAMLRSYKGYTFLAQARENYNTGARARGISLKRRS